MSRIQVSKFAGRIFTLNKRLIFKQINLKLYLQNKPERIITESKRRYPARRFNIRLMRLIIFTLVLLIRAFGVQCQDFNTRLSSIEKITGDINASLDSFRQLKLENTEVREQTTDSGVELIGYFKENQIQKIELSVGLSYGMKEFEFFYENSKLIYVKELLRQFIWDDSKGTFDYTKTERTFR